MRAFAIDRYKSKDGGRIVDLPQPHVGDNDVLVQVHAAGVNVLDTKIAAGEFKIFLPYRFPLVLGNDVAGVVVQVGARVRRFKPGDEVYARPDKDRIGTFAEFISMNEADVALKPRELSMVEAASVPLVGLTAWQALVEKANVQPGQKVFIQAGTGGVGTFAIQLAKHLGATVATTASAANFELVRALGADVLVDYKTEDFETKLHGYDVVLHSQDSKTLDKSLRVLKPGGRLISISGPPDPAFADEIGLPWYVKSIVRVLSFGARRKARARNVTFSFLFMRADGEQLSAITSLIDQGVIRSVVEKVFPFESTKDALDYIDRGRAKGKVVVDLM
ncbi:NADP-dependent oxidoreductase [Mycolicibacterium setense]|uniref:NADP-dependent oxidoreductase n=1 Tax=Mycolicibacterium setense TaxID=431269 RepID=UPI000574F7B9|nr:NADP-dependent oxidoreductase [Mycolicibacterium setense]KHO18189.1 NADPH:quinone oxidoreductase [Mycolicibacterium setense]MCV7111913.1 NADP-dependent oxidoreductase [Mycolicibacterium setense]